MSRKSFYTTAVSMVALLGGIFTLYIGLDNHFAKADELKSLKYETVQTFKQIQRQITKRDLQQNLMFLIERKFRIRDLLRKYPNDVDLHEEYEDVKKQIEHVKNQLNENE